MNDKEKVELLQKLVTYHNTETPARFTYEEIEALKALRSEGLVFDTFDKIKQGTTYYTATYLFVSPKGKLSIRKYNEAKG